MQEYQSIGSTKKPFGVKGELKVNIEESFLEDFLKAKVLFIPIKGKPVPYFVENIRVAGMPLLKLEEVDDKEAAAAIGGKDLLLRKEDVLEESEREMEVEEVTGFERYLGFSIVDEEAGAIGVIAEIIEFPQQEMALVQYEGKEILIPMHEHLIKNIDPENKKIQMTLPDGLLDL